MKTTLTNLQKSILALGLIIVAGHPTQASLADWQNQVSNVGTPPARTNFNTVNGAAPVIFDVGPLSLDRSFEFIVNAGVGGMSGAFLGNRAANGVQGLKFEQFPDTLVYGITDFGVTDFSSNDVVMQNTDTHVAFVSDGVSTTQLYVNGANVETFATPLRIVDNQGLAAVLESTGAFTDVLDGNILGAASYDSALSPAEVAAHSNAFFIPEPSAAALVGLAALGCFTRRNRRP